MFRPLAVAFATFVMLLTAASSRAGEMGRLTSKHYVVHTDLDRALSEDLARRMDAMFEDYSRRLADFNPDRTIRFEVYLFAKRQAYMDFTKNKVPNTGGVFMPARNALAAYLEGQGRDAMRRTLQHEAFHQFAHSAISIDLAPWINEGLASVFEEGIFMGRTFTLGQVPPRRVRQLQADIAAKRLIPFKKMMAMSLEDWAVALSGERSVGSTQYNQAWAMCHFLTFYTDNGTPVYRKRTLDMLARIHNGAGSDEAFRAAFSDNIDGFQQRFLEFARSLKPTPEASVIERQDILADMLVALSEKGKRFDTLDEFRQTLARGQYRMTYTKDDIKWNSDPDPQTYFKNLNGQVLTKDEMYFAPRTGAALPDLVLRAPGQIKLRTRFHDVAGNRIEHEVLVDEPAR